MNYEFGCIVDCRKDPSIKHFALSFGVDRKDRVMYYIITSRIYRAFHELCDFFNEYCVNEKCYYKHFSHKFKEKDKIIKPVKLSDVFFISQRDYPLRLTNDSMIIINSEPEIKEVSAFNQLKMAGLVFEADALSVKDKQRLYTHIKTSVNISPNMRSQIGQNFNKLKIK